MASAQQEVQDLLRFLTKDAKVPLATAMSKINELRKSNLNSSDLIANTSLPNVQKHFQDEKVAKQVFNAAKRAAKKRTSSGDVISPASKRARKSPEPGNHHDDARAFEDSLELPICESSEDELKATVLQSNRAPLVLAFCVTLLRYTMPEQPLSSRLSLSQAVVSLGAKSKARAIGLETSKTAEDEGWAQGQPKVRIMSRDIPILRRAGYHVEAADAPDSEADSGPASKKVKQEGDDKDHDSQTPQSHPPDQEQALWGLDLDALRASNGPLIPKASPSASQTFNGLPIYSPVSARSYILRSFTIAPNETEPIMETPKSKLVADESSPTRTSTAQQPTKKKSPAQLTAEKSHALALLLRALDLLFKSWSNTLAKEELDRRAWSWYVTVRPDVEYGQSGWGQRGEIRLARILGLRKPG